MIPTFRRLLALAVAAPLVMGACGPDDEVDDMEIDTQATEAPTTTTPSAPMAIQLDAMGNSGIEGEGSAMHRGEEVEVTLALAGLTADDITATIEPGSCPMSSPTSPTGPDAGEGATGMEEGEMEEGDMGDRDRMEQEIAEIDLNVSGNSATGSATFSASEIAGGAHIAVRDASDMLIACGDIRDQAAVGGTTDQGAGGEY